MRYNVISYFLSEGFKNVFKNKKSTFSCLGVMCATMLMFGIFYAIGQNINNIITEVEDAQTIRVFISNEATEEEYESIGQQIKKIEGVNTVEPKTQEDAYNEVKENLEEYQELMEGMEPEIFSASYIVTLTDLELNESVQNQISELGNIKKIRSNNETISALSNIGKWIRIVTGAILVVLIVISVFIIANTIKLTVHARRKEISIMKYVGATNSFIRAPFMIEGIVIGIISSIISLGVISALYNVISIKMMQSSTLNMAGISVLSFSHLFTEIVIVYAVLGIGIGIMRKFNFNEKISRCLRG